MEHGQKYLLLMNNLAYTVEFCRKFENLYIRFFNGAGINDNFQMLKT
jgi:hypothetical protein